MKNTIKIIYSTIKFNFLLWVIKIFSLKVKYFVSCLIFIPNPTASAKWLQLRNHQPFSNRNKTLRLIAATILSLSITWGTLICFLGPLSSFFTLWKIFWSPYQWHQHRLYATHIIWCMCFNYIVRTGDLSNTTGITNITRYTCNLYKAVFLLFWLMTIMLSIYYDQ